MTAALTAPLPSTYRAPGAILGVRIFTPVAAGVVPRPGALEFDDNDHAVSLRLRSEQAVNEWTLYLYEQGARVTVAPHAEDEYTYRAEVIWDGWTVTVWSPDPAADAHAALTRAVAERDAARGAA